MLAILWLRSREGYGWRHAARTVQASYFDLGFFPIGRTDLLMTIQPLQSREFFLVFTIAFSTLKNFTS